MQKEKTHVCEENLFLVKYRRMLNEKIFLSFTISIFFLCLIGKDLCHAVHFQGARLSPKGSQKVYH